MQAIVNRALQPTPAFLGIASLDRFSLSGGSGSIDNVQQSDNCAVSVRNWVCPHFGADVNIRSR
jgi:hypothetical protein